MTKRYAVFLRHGDYHQREGAPSAHQPFGLTKAGRMQARASTLLLATMASSNGWRIHPVIHSSNLLRGWQTADIIRQELGGIERVDSFDDLAERGLGSAANLTVDEINAVIAADPRFDTPPTKWKSDSHYRLPLQGAESLMDAGERVAAHVRKALSQISQDNTMMIFVGHGAAFRHAAHVLGAMRFEDIAKHSMFHATPVALLDCADAPWQLSAGEWKVRAPQEEAMD
ncbi:histidine phosphatase family protein [Magnetovibrio sp. PR-2]|uniref:histidine phosphatase family protein n=1 Tax=Magnetovibrio sp. PR-2 TaxID=3120356 RepID=UPI002FCE0048